MPRLFSFVSTEDGGGSGWRRTFTGGTWSSRRRAAAARRWGPITGPEEVHGSRCRLRSLRLEAGRASPWSTPPEGTGRRGCTSTACPWRPTGGPRHSCAARWFLLRRNEPPAAMAGLAGDDSARFTRAWPRVLQRTDRRAARLAAQREGGPTSGVRRERGYESTEGRGRPVRWRGQKIAGVSTRQRGRQGGGQAASDGVKRIDQRAARASA